MVCLRLEELVDQVAVGGVDFHAVEPCLLRSLGGSPVVLHDPRDLGRFQRPWDFVRLLAGGRVDVRLVALDGRGSDGGLAAVETAMRGSSRVPKLEEDHTALFMHGVGGVLPPFGHLVGVDARRLVPAVRLLGDRGGLADEQARRTALGVVFGHQAVREPSGPGPAAGHGGQDDPVRQGQVAQAEGLKEDVVHLSCSCLNSYPMAGNTTEDVEHQVSLHASDFNCIVSSYCSRVGNGNCWFTLLVSPADRLSCESGTQGISLTLYYLRSG